MKEVENVTGRMGEGETMAPAEEAASVASAPVESQGEAAAGGKSAVAGDVASTGGARAPEAAVPVSQEAGVDPWGVLLRAGTQLISALRAAGDAEAASHPWVERDPTTGACSLKLPLPAPQTARRLAAALSAIADSLPAARAGE
jgi:hypothetical protein